MKLLTITLPLLFLPVFIFSQAPGDVIISEFMADPLSVADNKGEYIEFYNNSATSWNLNGCVLTIGNKSRTLVGNNLNIPFGGYLVMAHKKKTVPNARYEYGTGNPLLLHDHGSITLTCGGVQVTRVTYTFQDLFGEGHSFEIINISSNGVMNERDYIGGTDPFFYRTGQGPDFGSPGVARSSGILPIELIYFNAVARDERCI